MGNKHRKTILENPEANGNAERFMASLANVMRSAKKLKVVCFLSVCLFFSLFQTM
jgi:hypothetical protein